MKNLKESLLPFNFIGRSQKANPQSPSNYVSPVVSPPHSPICLILRGRWDKSALQTAREIACAGNLDWDGLRQIADTEALAPLFYHILRGQDWILPSVEAQWRNAYYHNACRNTLLLRELAVVLDKLAIAGVDVLVLKGAALAETIYGDIAVRPMSDVDLLIHPQDLPTARQVLATLGYRSAVMEMQAGFTEEFRNEEIHFKSGLIDIYIDLHWRLVSPVYYQRRFLSDWFWETALPAKIGGASALVLGSEAQIVYLCAHLMLHHGGKSFLWSHDIAEVIRFYEGNIDWEKVLTKAQAYNLVLSVQQILLQLTDEWQVTIPEEVRSQLAALQPCREEVRTFSWQHQTMALRLFADLASDTDWLTRLRIAWDTLFPTRAYMQQRYRIPHPVLVPLYYPYRWLRGLKRVPGG